MKVTVVIVLAVGAAIGLLSAFSPVSTDVRAPRVPGDVFHTIVITDSGCLTCHTPGRQSPLRDTHPREASCFSCHVKSKNG